VYRRQLHIELCCESKAILDRADADPGGDDRIVDGEIPAAGDAHDRVLKAGREAGGEELLRVGARSSVAAHLGRRGEVDVEADVAGAPMALAATRGGCLCRVTDANGPARPGARRRSI